MDYYVLKQGRTEGPFTRAELADQLAKGLLAPADLGQVDGSRYWKPLRRLFDGPEAGNNGAPASTEPDLEALSGARPPALPKDFGAECREWLSSTWSALSQLFRRYPIETGLVFLVLGCVVLLLSYVRALIIAPVLAGALYGGSIAMLRGRVLEGLALCAVAVFLPVLLWSALYWLIRVIEAGA